MGRVTDTIKSKDGEIGAAKLRVVTNGKVTNITRPVNKLFPFEYNDVQQRGAAGGV